MARVRVRPRAGASEKNGLKESSRVVSKQRIQDEEQIENQSEGWSNTWRIVSSLNRVKLRENIR